MQKIDGHVHLEHGPLSVAYVEQFVAAAQKAGLDCLQILDHTHRFREFRPAYQSVIDADPLQAQWLSGKGKFKEVFIVTSYSIFPIILYNIIFIPSYK